MPPIQLVSPKGGSTFSKCGIFPAAVVESTPSTVVVDSSSLVVAVDSSSLAVAVAVDSSSLAVSAVPSPAPPAGWPPAASRAKSTCALGVELEKEFPVVFNAVKDLPPVINHVQHHIETTGRPLAAKYRRLDPAKLKAVNAEFREMEQQGVIHCSSSNWASPLHMVKKADGSWRPCSDFLQLNTQTKPDLYTCQNMVI